MMMMKLTKNYFSSSLLPFFHNHSHLISLYYTMLKPVVHEQEHFILFNKEKAFRRNGGGGGALMMAMRYTKKGTAVSRQRNWKAGSFNHIFSI